jgi:hypothetical protein
MLKVATEVNAEKTKEMFMSRHQNEEQYRYINVANKSFKNVAKFKYLSTAVTN